MGKPGSRTAHIKIIDRPELKSPLRHIVEHAVTTFLWVLWAYWILPIVTILLWGLGVRMTYLTFLDPEQMKELMKVIQVGGVLVLTVLIIFIVWINYNYHYVFKKLGHRRTESARATDADIGRFFDVNPASMGNLRQYNRYEISLSGNKATIHSAQTVLRSKQ